MNLKAIAFDLGHTLMDEILDLDVPIEVRPINLMPGAEALLPQLSVPLALWTNTRVAKEAEVRAWLARAGFSDYFSWVITSVDAGARKPAARFFEYALSRSGLAKEDVLFVGNQQNADIAGADAFGIRSVWLSGSAFQSPDDTPCDARATYTIESLEDLPGLLEQI